MNLEKRLEELKLRLPDPPSETHYAAAVRSGHLVFASGQPAKAEGRIAYRGQLGGPVGLDAGRKAARLCLLNALAAVGTLTDINNIKKIIKLTCYVASAAGFVEQHKVLGGATELAAELFEGAQPAATAVGVSELPEASTVIIDLVVELR